MTISTIRRLMGRKALQAKWIKAIEHLSGINMSDAFYKARSNAHYQEYSFSQDLSNPSSRQKSLLRIDVEFQEHVSKHESHLYTYYICINVSVLGQYSGQHNIGFKKIEFSSSEDVNNPELFLAQCTDMFERARSFIEDEYGYINTEIVKQALIRRDEIHAWLEKLTLLMVENEENPYKGKIISHLIQIPNDYKSSEVEAKLLKYMATKHMIECMSKQEESSVQE